MKLTSLQSSPQITQDGEMWVSCINMIFHIRSDPKSFSTPSSGKNPSKVIFISTHGHSYKFLVFSRVNNFDMDDLHDFLQFKRTFRRKSTLSVKVFFLVLRKFNSNEVDKGKKSFFVKTNPEVIGSLMQICSNY